MAKLPEGWELHSNKEIDKRSQTTPEESESESELEARIRMKLNYFGLLVQEHALGWQEVLRDCVELSEYEQAAVAATDESELCDMLEEYTKKWSLHGQPPISEEPSPAYIAQVAKILKERLN